MKSEPGTEGGEALSNEQVLQQLLGGESAKIIMLDNGQQLMICQQTAGQHDPGLPSDVGLVLQDGRQGHQKVHGRGHDGQSRHDGGHGSDVGQEQGEEEDPLVSGEVIEGMVELEEEHTMLVSEQVGNTIQINQQHVEVLQEEHKMEISQDSEDLEQARSLDNSTRFEPDPVEVQLDQVELDETGNVEQPHVYMCGVCQQMFNTADDIQAHIVQHGIVGNEGQADDIAVKQEVDNDRIVELQNSVQLEVEQRTNQRSIEYLVAGGQEVVEEDIQLQLAASALTGLSG